MGHTSKLSRRIGDGGGEEVDRERKRKGRAVNTAKAPLS